MTDPSTSNPGTSAPAREKRAHVEERFRVLLEGIDAIVWEVSLADGGTTYVSPHAQALLGYPCELWSSSDHFWANRIVHPEDRAAIVAAREAAIAERRDHELVYRALTADGAVVWLRDLARVIRAADGTPTHVAGVIVDITGRKTREREAAEVLRRHETLLASAWEGIYGIGPDGNTTFANPAATRILGWPADELVGRSQHQVIHHSHADGTPYSIDACPIYLTLRDGQVRLVENEVFWRRDGRAIPVSYTSTPILEEGRVMGAVVTFRDVTVERERARQLTESQEQLLEAQRLAHLGSWEWNIASDAVTWSPELYRLFGIEDDGTPRSYAAYLALVHPEDRERVDATIHNASRSGSSFDFEDRIVRPDGSVRSLRTRGHAVLGPDGEVTGLLGTCQDVTAEKESAQREMELEREQAARARAEEERQRTAFLAEASALLSSSLDYEKTLANLAYLAVPRLADWCVIDIVEDGEVRRLVTAHPDPRKEALARELAERYPAKAGTPTPVAEVIRTARPLVVRDVSQDRLAEITRDAEHLRIVSELDIASYLVVPMLAGGQVLGAFTFIAGESGRRYSEADLPLAEELVQRASLAVENARLYRTAEESRAEVTLVLESIGDAFFALDSDWRFTYVNRHAESLLQRQRGELLGKNLWEEFGPAIGTRFEEMYRRAMAEQRTVQFDEHYGPLGGWYEVRAFPAGGGLSVYFRDVREQKEAQLALERSEQRFRSLVRASASIVWTTPASGEFASPQPEWSDFTGQTFAQLAGTGWLDAIHPEDRDRTIAAWQAALADRTVLLIEHRVRRHDGEYRTMQVRAVPVAEPDGEIREWVGVHLDVSAQKRAEEERERAVAIRNRFYAAMSHELRTPINAMLGYTDLILSGAYGPLNDKQEHGIDRAHRAAKHLLELVNDVLDLSKLEAGKVELELDTVDLRELVDDLFATVLPLSEARGSELRLVAEQPPSIFTDPRRVRQILLNLLSNAIKFGEGHPVAVVCRRSEEGGAIVEVVDQGVGISQENIPRIFEEFVQVGEEKGGTGLGLPISVRMAELLGGRLEVASEEGKGSTFRLVLPARPPVA